MSNEKKINNLIEQISSEAETVKPFSVHKVFVKWLLFTVIYLAAISSYFGIRTDIFQKLTEVNYLIEILCLVSLVLNSLYSSINLALPDYSQRKSVLYMPVISIILFIAVLVYLCVYYPVNIPIDHQQGLRCIACITVASIIPSAFLFFEVKKAATTKPNLLSFYIIIYATALSALALRLEPSDSSIYQTIIYHYSPIIVFAIIAFLFPKKFLHW